MDFWQRHLQLRIKTKLDILFLIVSHRNHLTSPMVSSSVTREFSPAPQMILKSPFCKNRARLFKRRSANSGDGVGRGRRRARLSQIAEAAPLPKPFSSFARSGHAADSMSQACTEGWLRGWVIISWHFRKYQIIILTSFLPKFLSVGLQIYNCRLQYEGRHV